MNSDLLNRPPNHFNTRPERLLALPHSPALTCGHIQCRHKQHTAKDWNPSQWRTEKRHWWPAQTSHRSPFDKTFSLVCGVWNGRPFAGRRLHGQKQQEKLTEWCLSLPCIYRAARATAAFNSLWPMDKWTRVVGWYHRWPDLLFTAAFCLFRLHFCISLLSLPFRVKARKPLGWGQEGHTSWFQRTHRWRRFDILQKRKKIISFWCPHRRLQISTALLTKPTPDADVTETAGNVSRCP